MPELEITILGCGGSFGVPCLGCSCSVCTSTNPKNKRTRCAALVRNVENDFHLLIDAGSDLRQQLLREGIQKIDAVVITHGHADHFHGLDDLRSLMLRKSGDLPCYMTAETQARVLGGFGYFFGGGAFFATSSIKRAAKPHIVELTYDSPLTIGGIPLTPFPLEHGGRITMTALSFGGYFVYASDTSGIPSSAERYFANLKALVLNCLTSDEDPHEPKGHLRLSESLAICKKFTPGRTILTHMKDAIDYDHHSTLLPPGVEFAYDGLRFTVVV